MNKEIISAVMLRLREAAPELRWIDIEEGQLYTQERPAVAFPCCLVDMGYDDCETLANGRQNVTARVILRIAFAVQGSASLAAPEPARTQSLGRLDTVQRIHEGLQLWRAGGLTKPFKRRSVRPEQRAGGLKVYTAVYEFKLVD